MKLVSTIMLAILHPQVVAVPKISKIHPFHRKWFNKIECREKNHGKHPKIRMKKMKNKLQNLLSKVV